jgi:release factor glutamine methyltransferase
MRVGDWLARARSMGVARLDAQLLVAHQLRRPRAWVIAHVDDPVDADDGTALEDALARRTAGVPLAYLTGEREFHGLRLAVTGAVLVPRPETELLVDWALERIDPLAEVGVADLGTGSGAIALAVKHARPRARVTATDTSVDALDVARANARRLGLEVEWVCGDWWEPLAGRCFDLVLSNPPYVAAGDPHLVALAYEPAGALTSGGDGLDALRQIISGASAHLHPGGSLLLEHGHDQGRAVRDLLVPAGFGAIETRRDLSGHPRATGGRRGQ